MTPHEKILDWVLQEAAESLEINLAEWPEPNISPIERIFLEAWAAHRYAAGYPDPLHLCEEWPNPPESDPFMIHPQQPIGPYRVDFLITFDPDDGGAQMAAVVECDGHDFHEKTKEQAAHDKKRDRYLQSQGLTVLRFTGSELYRDPMSCAFEVWRSLTGQLERRRA